MSKGKAGAFSKNCRGDFFFRNCVEIDAGKNKDSGRVPGRRRVAPGHKKRKKGKDGATDTHLHLCLPPRRGGRRRRKGKERGEIFRRRNSPSTVQRLRYQGRGGKLVVVGSSFKERHAEQN